MSVDAVSVVEENGAKREDMQGAYVEQKDR